ncbi:MAG: hypothetical protein GY884_23805 [Proteobacteria bacterium]|nr:hypothetical protein [Pseudomonadota bacterium]
MWMMLLACTSHPVPKAPPGVTVAVMGDVPYAEDEWATLDANIALSNGDPNVDLLVHVGDIRRGADCQESSYVGVAGALQTSTHPVWILVGDNEWNDCGREGGPGPDVAWAWWQEHLAPLNGDPAWRRQEGRPENLAWTQDDVLVLGLMLPGGRKHDDAVWDALLDDAASWVRSEFAAHPDARAVIITGHAKPEKRHQRVVEAMQESARAFGKPVRYIHGDGHDHEDHPAWGGVPNLRRVMVERGGDEAPAWVTARDGGTEIEVQRGPSR